MKELSVLDRSFSLATKGLLLFLIATTLPQGTLSAKHCNPDTLRNIAEAQGKGYKTANLILLREDVCIFLNQQKKTIYTFAVPGFVAVSSNQVQDFLQKNGLNLVQRWQAIVQQHFPHQQASLNQVFKNQKFPYGFLDDVKKLELDVIQAFDTVIQQASDQTKIDELFGLDEQNRQELQRVLQAQGKLMVRSTGKEDTEELANAGGNESVANVSPNPKDILNAIKRVVASYFGEKSLTQRLCAQDRSLVDAPFTPVLIQRMIGEIEEQELPRCGVMFTEEPEGALSKKRIRREDETLKTSGITLIQGAFGHNEGVVNSIVPVDTYYVDVANRIYPHIKEKRFRIAPVAEGKLGRKNNPPQRVNQPSLEPEAVKALKLLANKLEDFYQKPMDVEYVIMNGTIFIVQARPIVHDPNQETPSYLDLNHDLIKNSAKISGQTIGAGGGALRFIEYKQQIIIKKNIRDALAFYQSPETDRNKIRAIVVGEMAPATSHEATTFRSESKPVIACEKDFETLEQRIAQGNAQFIVDIQQQLIVQLNEKNFDRSFIKEGWINYPIPQLLSVMPAADSKAYKLLTGRLFGNKAVDQIKEAQRAFMQTITQNSSAVLQDLILQLKTADQKTALQALKKIWLFASFVSVQPGYGERIHAQLTALARAMIALIPKLNITQDNNDYLAQRLFPIHMIQTLLFQQPKDVEALYGDSTIKLMSQLREEKRGAQDIVPNAATHAKLAGILGNYAFTPELKTAWTAFINDLNVSADEQIKQQFYAMLVQLGKLDLLVLWLHTSFAESKIKNPRDLIQEFTGAQDFLNLMLERKQPIDDLNPASFDNPSGFLKCWNNFVNNILDYFLADFMDHFTAAPRLGKLAALKVMESLVTQFDASIKAVTGSTNFVVTNLPEGKTFDDVRNNEALLKQQIASKKDKIFTFHIMLEWYEKLLRKWNDLLRRAMLPLRFNQIYSLKNTNDPNQLKAVGFDVTTTVLGSTAMEDRMPRLDTHEKYFTCCHQSLIYLIANSLKETGPKISSFPKCLQYAHNKVENYLRASLISINFSHGKLGLLYNYPQRNHSAQIQLEYSNRSEQFSLKLMMFGENVAHEYRWHKIEDFLKLKTILIDTPYMSSKSDDIVNFEWISLRDLDYKEKIKQIIKLCEHASHLAFNPHFNIEYFMDTNEQESFEFSKLEKTVKIFKSFLEKNYLLWGTIGFLFFMQKNEKLNNLYKKLKSLLTKKIADITPENLIANDPAENFEEIVKLYKKNEDRNLFAQKTFDVLSTSNRIDYQEKTIKIVKFMSNESDAFCKHVTQFLEKNQLTLPPPFLLHLLSLLIEKNHAYELALNIALGQLSNVMVNSDSDVINRSYQILENLIDQEYENSYEKILQRVTQNIKNPIREGFLDRNIAIFEKLFAKYHNESTKAAKNLSFNFIDQNPGQWLLKALITAEPNFADKALEKVLKIAEKSASNNEIKKALAIYHFLLEDGSKFKNSFIKKKEAFDLAVNLAKNAMNKFSQWSYEYMLAEDIIKDSPEKTLVP
jgi:ribosomal protein L22